MRSHFPKILIVLALMSWGAEALASETACMSGQVSPTKLRVTIKPEQRGLFIKFLQSTEVPLALGARYVGGAEDSNWISIDYLEVPDEAENSRIDIDADNRMPSPVFVFTFQSCNTTRSLKPYIDAARKRVAQFGPVSIVTTTSK